MSAYILTIIAISLLVGCVLCFLIGVPYYLSRIADSLEKKDESEVDTE